MKKNISFFVSVTLLAFVIAIKLIYLSVDSAWIFFLLYRVDLIVFVLIVFVVFYTGLKFLYSFKKGFFKAIVPFLISLLCLSLWATNIVDVLWIKSVYFLNIDKYGEVVELIESDQIDCDTAGCVLPQQYEDLSVGGQVLVEQKGDNLFVMFLTFSGALDSFSGYVYSSMDIEPFTPVLGGDFKEVTKKQDNWYWAVSY